MAGVQINNEIKDSQVSFEQFGKEKKEHRQLGKVVQLVSYDSDTKSPAIKMKKYHRSIRIAIFIAALLGSWAILLFLIGILLNR